MRNELTKIRRERKFREEEKLFSGGEDPEEGGARGKARALCQTVANILKTSQSGRESGRRVGESLSLSGLFVNRLKGVAISLSISSGGSRGQTEVGRFFYPDGTS